MKIELLDIDKLIKVNKLEEITSPITRSGGGTFDPDGILSYEIFGASQQDRRNTFAYIDLQRKFLHPHIYNNILKRMYKKITSIINGQSRVSVVDGWLVDDPNGWTGLSGLYKHWDEIDWKKKNSANQINTKILDTLKRDEVFVDKWIVVPPAYRDMLLQGSKDSSSHTSDLNPLYNALIRNIALLDSGGLFSKQQYNTESRIEDLLVDVFKYFENLIKSKNGLIKKSLMGKSVDFGARTVISAPSYRYNRFEDAIVDYSHCAAPISLCCSTFYPFIEAWLKTFFMREYGSDPYNFSFIDPKTKERITAPLNDPAMQFSNKNIKKMINNFIDNPDNRYTVVTVEVLIPQEDGTDKKENAYMLFHAKQVHEDGRETDYTRPLTITDLMYMAAVDVTRNRHLLISRHPIGTDKSLIFQKMTVQSTTDHIHLKVMGEDYPLYPDIKLDTPHDKVGIQFSDTLVYANEHLGEMGADYDTLTTVVIKLYICWKINNMMISR